MVSCTGKGIDVSATPRPQHEVPDNGPQESDFWGLVGTVVIPIVSIALLGLAVASAPRLLLNDDPNLMIQPSAGRSPLFDIPHEQPTIVAREWYRHQPTRVEPLPAEQSPLKPFPVEPPLTVPTESPPLVTAERHQPPGRIEPAPLPPDQAESLPLSLEASEPAAVPGGSPPGTAAVPGPVPSTPQPPTPKPPALEPPTLEPSLEAQLTELPATPEPTPLAPAGTERGPARPGSPQPTPPLEVEREPPTPEPSAAAQLAELPASPEPRPAAPVATRPGPAQPVSPQPRQPVDVAREPPPAEAAPEPPAAALQVQPEPRSGSVAAETPQVAMVRPGPDALLEQLLPPGRGSGQKLLARLAATQSVEDCGNRDLPFFRVLESNVEPGRLAPGDRFSHRLVYALCPAEPAAQLTATVTREVRGSAGVVLADKADGLRLRPGTWASDEELAVPANTDPGAYTVTTTVLFGGSAWTEQTDLLIE